MGGGSSSGGCAAGWCKGDNGVCYNITDQTDRIEGIKNGINTTLSTIKIKLDKIDSSSTSDSYINTYNNIYVKNSGITSHRVILNNKEIENKYVGWDANYDGVEANISLDMLDNGMKKHYDIELTNEDLENILNIIKSNNNITDNNNYDEEKHYMPLIDLDKSTRLLSVQDFDYPDVKLFNKVTAHKKRLNRIIERRNT